MIRLSVRELIMSIARHNVGNATHAACCFGSGRGDAMSSACFDDEGTC